MLSEKCVSQLLRYACDDLPSLENRMRKLRSDIIDLEFKRKDSENSLRLQSAQLLDLGQTITKYQNAIDSKKQQ
jgi:chromosome segregation ATPase